MSEYRIELKSYYFDCPKCRTRYELAYNMDGESINECGNCASKLIIDASHLKEMFVDPIAAYNLGMRAYNYGNWKDALKYFTAAAECNHPASLNMLFLMYDAGTGTEQNTEIADSYLEKAAIMGDKNALVTYGNRLCNKGDTETAAIYYKQAINKGSADAMYNYALMVIDGLNGQKPEQSILDLLERAGDMGLPEAYNKLGLVMEQLGRIDVSFDWYKKAANAGGASGQFNVGRFYYYGKENGPDYPDKDIRKAYSYFLISARQYYPEAMFFLSSCYEKGEGVAEDIETSLIWLKRAAEQEQSLAQYKLGVWYLKNNNNDEGCKWIIRSKDNGQRLAINFYNKYMNNN